MRISGSWNLPLGIRRLSLIVLLLATAKSTTAGEWSFRVRFSEQVHQEAYTGRVYLFFSNKLPEPRLGPNWFRPELFIARDVENWQPGETITFSSREIASLITYPRDAEQIEPIGYRAQAVVRFNPHQRNIGTGAGNGYSQVIRVAEETETQELLVDRLVEEKTFPETDRIKLLRLRSKLLSDFHGRDVYLNGAVTLPSSYPAEPELRYPTIYVVPGFGGTHFNAQKFGGLSEKKEQGVEFLRVLLDPSCPRGHHVFADSANNGPVGAALVNEFISEFERTYRAIAAPSARFLTGHSSGGWSTLWLQVTYPETFGGVWSTSPDPVDFRDFQRINLYQPDENMYVDAEGEKRPLARNRGKVVLWYQGFADMEWTLGYGGQLHSFEAAFSPRGADGKPRLIWDRQTGKVDTEVTRTWERYDIRLILERNWSTLGPKLAGKLHVFMGDADTFYLEGASVLLKETLEQLGSDAVVEIHPGKTHFNLLSPDLRKRIQHEMVETFLQAHPEQGGERVESDALETRSNREEAE